ncbi:hypothetical protein [Gloeothece verrucosa]|uniref:Uncharacterized protein n=1 Tax=Gloeothece verrucosa (strain PCC 7822) TaxID=497965 RepID=E0U6Q2_GLOV7|nr:hypothetical protein [Gloeothece verrucosa]ADN14811.1 conserved hypothetical protein [Gloeothece verrucosa PCC 7822]
MRYAHQVQSLTLTDKLRLLDELKALVSQPVEVEGDEEIISPQEIAQSDAAWQDYLTGRDLGVSSKELKRNLF